MVLPAASSSSTLIRALPKRRPSGDVARVPAQAPAQPIAIRWMMCHGRHPPPAPPSCLPEKTRIPSPRRQRPRYQGPDAPGRCLRAASGRHDRIHPVRRPPRRRTHASHAPPCRPQTGKRSLSRRSRLLPSRMASAFLQAIPYSLFPIPYSLFPIPYSLFPITYSLFPIPSQLPAVSTHAAPGARLRPGTASTGSQSVKAVPGGRSCIRSGWLSQDARLARCSARPSRRVPLRQHPLPR
jgi:hypothetical protein